jgi:hypothetical protein
MPANRWHQNQSRRPDNQSVPSSIQQVANTIRQVLADLDTGIDRIRVALDTLQGGRELLASTMSGSAASESADALSQPATTQAQVETVLRPTLAARSATQHFLDDLRIDDRSNATEPDATTSSAKSWARAGAYLADKHVTTGLAFDQKGNRVGSELRSGRDELAAAAQQFLLGSEQFPRITGGAKIASTDHVETKYAMWMRRNDVRNVTVVINHVAVCGLRLGWPGNCEE